jgi:hypothetical protein
MLGVDWFECSAEGTGFIPLPASSLTAAMDSLVIGRGDEFEVFDSIVLLVSVDVMEVESIGNRAMVPFPLFDVGEPSFSVDVAPEIALSGDVVSVGSFGFWSGLCHASSPFTILK